MTKPKRRAKPVRVQGAFVLIDEDGYVTCDGRGRLMAYIDWSSAVGAGLGDEVQYAQVRPVPPKRRKKGTR